MIRVYPPAVSAGGWSGNPADLMPEWLKLVAVLLFILAASPLAVGCPVCDTGTGEQVRAGIADGNLGLNLAAVLLPFAVVLGVAAVIHFGLPAARNKHARRD